MYARPGHIPTAKNVSVMSLLDESGRYRQQEELAALFDDDRRCSHHHLLRRRDRGVVHRLRHDAARLLRHRGLHGSLQEWAADPANPMEVDTAAK